MNLKLENGSSQTRSVETRQHVNRRQELGNGISTRRNSGGQIDKPGKQANGTSSTIRTQTTACKEGEYCSQDSGPRNINKVHESDASRSIKRQYS
ncbi:hypothetical protein RhiirA4_454648 [Rhizophagus irregularis]|uniref:Uncharacterized protein n=1 Tax=Rhizophagus irregularis TaxID=588596 RepID=A0A2I1G3C8_9GLOM|nr:hypothetical protein RhiirA4_454648 [Rhizophagus irregularis]